MALKEGSVSLSLYSDALRVGIPESVTADVIYLLSFNIDFQRDIWPGTGFTVYYEQIINADNGEKISDGDVLYLKLRLVNGKELAFFHFQPPSTDSGKARPADYFDAQGHSARKALLRTPVQAARVSSGYGMRRHPIQGYTRFHKGIDFAAPIGTPIYAAGDGTITRRGFEPKGYGKWIEIQHANGYRTRYAHMDKIASTHAPRTPSQTRTNYRHGRQHRLVHRSSPPLRSDLSSRTY